MIIQVKVYPHSGKEELVKVSESSLKKTQKIKFSDTFNSKELKSSEKKDSIDSYNIYLKKPAEDNKANIELLKLLRRHFGVEAKIIKGLTSRNKIIKIGD